MGRHGCSRGYSQPRLEQANSSKPTARYDQIQGAERGRHFELRSRTAIAIRTRMLLEID